MSKQILIVDDLIINRRILSGMLCTDYEILEASSGEEALNILAHEPDAVAAVLLDISMPGMSAALSNRAAGPPHGPLLRTWQSGAASGAMMTAP